jgi:tetratricopeptide (TPR) repeat protein
MSDFEFQRNEQTGLHSTAPASVAAAPTSDVAAGPARLLSQLKAALDEFDHGPEAVAEQAAEKLPPVPDHPDVVAVLMKNAGILIENREYRLASNILRNVLMRVPDHPQALRSMGRCLMETSRYDEALKCFKALAKVTRTAEAFVLVADTLYLLENDGPALAAYREALRSVIADEARLFAIYKNLGNIHVRAGDFEAAEEFYNKAYTIDPNSDVLLVNYGTLEIQRERFDEAVDRFRRAVEVNSENDRAWVGLAMVHRQKGDFELARANIERAMDINPSNRTALKLVIDWGVQDGAFNVVIARLQDYLGINGEDAEMAFILAKVFTHVGRLNDARIEIERVLALDPSMEGAEPLKIALDREISRLSGRGAGAA